MFRSRSITPVNHGSRRRVRNMKVGSLRIAEEFRGDPCVAGTQGRFPARRAQDSSPRREAWEWGVRRRAPEGAEDCAAAVFRPVPGLRECRGFPTAYAVGYYLPLLRASILSVLNAAFFSHTQSPRAAGFYGGDRAATTGNGCRRCLSHGSRLSADPLAASTFWLLTSSTPDFSCGHSP